jgi:hypothetical protein
MSISPARHDAMVGDADLPLGASIFGIGDQAGRDHAQRAMCAGGAFPIAARWSGLLFVMAMSMTGPIG